MADLVGIDSISQDNLARLRSAGVHSTDILLKKCATPEQRAAVAQTFGFDIDLLTKWVHIADLFRIHGAGTQYVRLIIASGIDSTASLAHVSPEALLEKMAMANGDRKLVRQLPRLSTVTEWINTTKGMARRVIV